MKIKFLIPIFLRDQNIKDMPIALIDGQPLCTYIINSICTLISPEQVIIYFEEDIVKKAVERMEPYNKVNFIQGKNAHVNNQGKVSKSKNKIDFNFLQNVRGIMPDLLERIDSDWLIIVDPNYPLLTTKSIKRFLEEIKKTKSNNLFFCEDQSRFDLYDEKYIKINPSNHKSIFLGLTAWKFQEFKSDVYKFQIKENIKNSNFVEISDFETRKIDGLKTFKIVESILRGLRLNNKNQVIDYFKPNIIGIERDLHSILSKDDSALDAKSFEFESGKLDIQEVIKKMGNKTSWSYPFVINGQDQVCLIQQIKGESCRRHHHITKAEFWVVLKGTFVWRIKNQKIFVEEGEIIRLLPGETHIITCVSEKPGIRLAMGAAGMEHIYV